MTPCLLCVNILLLKMCLKNFGGSATKTSYEAFTKILTIWKTHVRHFTVLINAHRGMQHNPSYPCGARVEKVVFPKDTFKIHIPSISSALKKKRKKKHTSRPETCPRDGKIFTTFIVCTYKYLQLHILQPVAPLHRGRWGQRRKRTYIYVHQSTYTCTVRGVERKSATLYIRAHNHNYSEVQR